MNSRGLVLALSAALAGCQVTPKPNETTRPTLYFTVWYENATHNSASDDMSLVVGVANPKKCIFVASPFLVRVIGTDPGGIARLDVSNQGNNSLRVLNALTKADPAPGSPTQGDPVFGAYANPGSPFDPNGNGSQLTYFDFDAQTGGPVYNLATLEATFEFVAEQPANGVFLVEAWNASGKFSRIVNYNIRQAGDASGQQPGKPC